MQGKFFSKKTLYKNSKKRKVLFQEVRGKTPPQKKKLKKFEKKLYKAKKKRKVLFKREKKGSLKKEKKL